MDDLYIYPLKTKRSVINECKKYVLDTPAHADVKEYINDLIIKDLKKKGRLSEQAQK